MASITGGELVVRTLSSAGVSDIFTLHGAHLETIFQACLHHRIRVTDTRHEMAAGHAAEGYARARCSLGVAVVTAGPGFTNVLTSMANAYTDGTPVLYLAGSAPLYEAETRTLQGDVGQVAMAKSVTKWAHQVTTIAEIPRLLALAIRQSTSRPMGPVLIDLPWNVLAATVDETAVTIPATIRIDDTVQPLDSTIDEAIAVLSNARRPVIVAGTGTAWSKAGEELRLFAERSGIPVYSDYAGHGVLPSHHPLYCGLTHKMTYVPDNQRPDAALMLGTQLSVLSFGRKGAVLMPGAALVQVEDDPADLGRLADVAVGMVADCRSTLQLLNRRSVRNVWPDYSSWRHTIADSLIRKSQSLSSELPVGHWPMHPYVAAQTVVAAIPSGTIVVTDGALSFAWLNEVIHQNEPCSYITQGFFGEMGLGLGLAMGVQTARPDRRVVCITGDGGIGFTIAELNTMFRHKLPIVVVVMNNGSWGASQVFQEMNAGKDRLCATQLGDVRYDEIAKAFGCHAQRVTEAGKLAAAIDAAFASDRPACIDVVIDLWPVAPQAATMARSH